MALERTEMAALNAARAPTEWKAEAMQRRIRKRYAAERRFRALGLLAILVSAGLLAFLLVTMIGNGIRGFTQTSIALPIDFRSAPVVIDPVMLRDGNADMVLANANLPAVTLAAAQSALGPDAEKLISSNSWL